MKPSEARSRHSSGPTPEPLNHELGTSIPQSLGTSILSTSILNPQSNPPPQSSILNPILHLNPQSNPQCRAFAEPECEPRTPQPRTWHLNPSIPALKTCERPIRVLETPRPFHKAGTSGHFRLVAPRSIVPILFDHVPTLLRKHNEVTGDCHPVVDPLHTNLSGERSPVRNQCVWVINKKDEMAAGFMRAIGFDVIVKLL